MFARLKSTRLAIERERNLHALLDAAHEDLRQNIVVDATVDLAAMAPGWPLASGVANRFFSEEAQKMANALLKGGLKSVEVRLVKEAGHAGDSHPADALADQLTKLDFSTGLPIEGAAADVGWEGVKTKMETALGKTAGEATGKLWADSAFFAFDFLKFGLSAYEGMNVLDASRDRLRKVNEHIFALEQLDAQLGNVIADAQSAQEYCHKQIADGQPFDTNDPALSRVREHLGND